MVQRVASAAGERAPKRQKQNHEAPVAHAQLSSGDDVRKALGTQSPDALKNILVQLRNQLTIQPGEGPIAPGDGRLLLAKDWLDKSPGASEIFELWTSSLTTNQTTPPLCLSILACLLTLLNQHFIYQPLGDSIVHQLVSPNYIRRLNGYLGGAQADMILVTLKLFNAMVSFADGREKRSVMDGFAWGMKSLPKLLQMRRRGATLALGSDPFAKPDIRTLYITFLLSFVTPTTPIPLKAALLEDHRDAFVQIFKGIGQDPYEVVRRVLEICWEGIWSDGRLRRTAKIRLFNETSLTQLCKLYARNQPEGTDPADIPADLAHHFLLAITSRRGTGLCFRDRGWYPPVSEKDASEENMRGRVHNRTLGNLLKALKVNEDSRQQELALKILEACPELVQGYWSTAGLTLEPRLSPRWITNIAFLGSVIALPIPTYSFTLDIHASSSHSIPTYNPTPPQLATILESVLPTTFTKPYITKGLQASSPSLVRHLTSLALARCLDKFEALRSTFMEIEHALEEDPDSGQWARRRMEVEKEIKRRVPDFQVVVALSQRTIAPPSLDPSTAAVSDPGQATRDALLSEASLRLMWLYHRSLPSLAAEARFDPGKLLLSLGSVVSLTKEGTGGMETLGQLHVLRLLRESDQFTWSAKLGTTSRSHLYHILRLYTRTSVAVIRQEASSLVTKLLSRSVLFEHDPLEIDLWLMALPRTSRSPTARAPDEALLTDERDGVLQFLDDCIQRCLKTPYRYLEESLGFMFGSSSSDAASDPTVSSDNEEESPPRPDLAPSPLLMTLLEQLTVRRSKNPLSPSDTLAITTYTRKLVLSMATKHPNLALTNRVVQRVESVIRALPDTVGGLEGIKLAILREARLLAGGSSPLSSGGPDHKAVDDFLSTVADTPESGRTSWLAVELVDWIRLIDPPLLPTHITRIRDLIERWSSDPSTLRELFLHLEPSRLSLPQVISAVRSERLLEAISFETAFRFANEMDLLDQSIRDLLAKLLVRQATSGLLARAARLVLHRITSESDDARGLLLLLCDIALAFKAKSELDITIFSTMVFKETPRIRNMLCQPDKSYPALTELVRVTLNSASEVDHVISADYCLHWSTQVENSQSFDNFNGALPWIPYMDDVTLLRCLDTLMPKSPEITSSLLDAICRELQNRNSAPTTRELRNRVPRLLALHQSSRQSASLDDLLSDILDGHFPLGFDKQYPPSSHMTRFVDLAGLSDRRWSTGRERLSSSLSITKVLTAPPTPSNARIASALIYQSYHNCVTFAEWLVEEDRSVHITGPFLRALYAFVDVWASTTNDEALAHGMSAILTSIPLLLQRIFVPSGAVDEIEMVIDVLVRLSHLGHQSAVMASLSGMLDTVSLRATFRYHVQRLVLQLAQLRLGKDGKSTLESFLDRGLQWVVRRFAEDDEDSSKLVKSLKVFERIISLVPNVKPHLVEPVLSAGIQNRLASKDVLGFLVTLASHTTLKPANSNRVLQSILQHPLFLSTAAPSAETSARTSLVALIHALFHMHPLNASHPSHVTPLIKIYGGTLSTADRQILSLFQLFEQHRQLSVMDVMKQWSASAAGPSGSRPLDAIMSLDSTAVFRTCSAFPMNNNASEMLYDPAFILPLLAAAAMDPSLTGMDWVALFRTNCVSLAICALASRTPSVRDLASHVLLVLWTALQESSFQESDQSLYIINLVRDMLPAGGEDEDETTPRLATYPTLLLAHALRCVYYPSNFMYPILSRFLLQRHEVDQSDVPLLFSLLYSSSEDWKKERGWLVRFLADGMKSSADWKILTRRHTWDLVASLFQASTVDKALRSGILDLLVNMTANVRASHSLVLRSSVLSWIELQILENLQPEEVDRWLVVLDNISKNIDQAKVEQATMGAWRGSIERALAGIASLQGPLVQILKASRILLRISNAKVAALPEFVSWLESAEAHLPLDALASEEAANYSSRPGIDPKDTALSSLWVWGQCIETLWEVSLTIGEMGDGWGKLTSRVLLWNSIHRDSKVGEWARRQTLNMLRN